MKNNTIYILDSYALIYRSYYAFISRPLVNEKGENVSAVYGFFNNFLSFIKHYDMHYAVAAFDSRTPTFRHEMYKEYKATRQKTPEDLHAQVPVIEEILTALGIKVIRKDGFEADDLIATVAEQCKIENRPCRILSGDKDLMQLVTDTTLMMRSDKAGGWEEVDRDGVIEEWGVPPERMLDILSLEGDTADNIPGIPGVGKKTAQKLLAQYDNLDNVLANAENITGAIGKKVQAGIESAKFSRELIKLRYDVPINEELDSFCIDSPDYAAASRLLYRFGVPKIAKRFASLSGDKNIIDEESDTGLSPSDSTVNSDDKTENSSTNSPFYPVDDLPSNVQLEKNTGNYSGITKLEDLEKLIDGFLSKKADDGKIYVAFDCETDSLNTITAKLAGFSLCNESKVSHYVPIITAESANSESLFEEAPLYISKDDAVKQLERLFYNEDVILIMHNGKFDYEVLISNGLGKDKGFPPTCKIYDTLIAAWLLHPDRSSFSLEKLTEAKLFIQTIPYNTIVPKDKNFTDVPLETAIKYGSEDSDFTFQLWEIYKEELKRDGLFSLFEDMEMKVLPILANMELEGIHIEKEELAKYGEDLKQQIEAIQKEIFEIVGHEFNIASPKQLQEVLFTERGLVASKKTKTGYSTDTAVLEELVPYDPVPGKILEFRKLTKLLSTYVDALPVLADKNDRLHTSFVQSGTATGRLSSRDPNLQNIPVRDENGRKIRQAFSAREGYSLISADYSQIELVILAHLSKDKNLCEAFNSGNDVHKATASLIFNLPPEEIQPDMRRTAKTINFGVIYGMSAFRLSNELGIPRSTAQKFIDSYFATYSGVQTFINETIEKAEKKGYVETIMGRRRYIKAINSKNKTEKKAAERVAVNTPIQGSAADVVKMSMICVNSTLKEKFPEAKMLLQVHDEIILECPENQAEEVAKTVKDCMENIIKLNVPLKVSVEIGKRWGEFH